MLEEVIGCLRVRRLRIPGGGRLIRGSCLWRGERRLLSPVRHSDTRFGQCCSRGLWRIVAETPMGREGGGCPASRVVSFLSRIVGLYSRALVIAVPSDRRCCWLAGCVAYLALRRADSWEEIFLFSLLLPCLSVRWFACVFVCVLCAGKLPRNDGRDTSANGYHRPLTCSAIIRGFLSREGVTERRGGLRHASRVVSSGLQGGKRKKVARNGFRRCPLARCSLEKKRTLLSCY